MPIPEADLLVLEFLAKLSNDLKFKPKTLPWLLKNWGYVLDQARPLFMRSTLKNTVVVTSEHQTLFDFVSRQFQRLTGDNTRSERLLCAINYFRLPPIFQNEFCAALTADRQLLLTTIIEEYYDWKKTREHPPNRVS